MNPRETLTNVEPTDADAGFNLDHGADAAMDPPPKDTEATSGVSEDMPLYPEE